MLFVGPLVLLEEFSSLLGQRHSGRPLAVSKLRPGYFDELLFSQVRQVASPRIGRAGVKVSRINDARTRVT